MVRARSAFRWELDSLSIEDVAVILSELGLSRLVGKFRKMHIDGVLLQKLTPDILRTELKMKQVEVILLTTFITKGHIPKRSKSRSRYPLPPIFLRPNRD